MNDQQTIARLELQLAQMDAYKQHAIELLNDFLQGTYSRVKVEQAVVLLESHVVQPQAAATAVANHFGSLSKLLLDSGDITPQGVRLIEQIVEEYK